MGGCASKPNDVDDAPAPIEDSVIEKGSPAPATQAEQPDNGGSKSPNASVKNNQEGSAHSVVSDATPDEEEPKPEEPLAVEVIKPEEVQTVQETVTEPEPEVAVAVKNPVASSPEEVPAVEEKEAETITEPKVAVAEEKPAVSSPEAETEAAKETVAAPEVAAPEAVVPEVAATEEVEAEAVKKDDNAVAEKPVATEERDPLQRLLGNFGWSLSMKRNNA